MSKKSETAAIPAQPAAPDDSARRSYNHPCLIAQALGVLGDRWTLLILRDMIAGLSRYTDILQSCEGMSPNVLSDRLKRLEAEGLVVRERFRGLPPRVEYSLTEKGWSVRPILLALLDWGREQLGPFPIERVGTEVSTDFAMRVVPAFMFDAGRAEGISASMVVEISDCDECNTWSFAIRGGRIQPRRHGVDHPDVVLYTTTTGFFQFIRGEDPIESCGRIEGCVDTARAIRACFLAS